MRIKSVGLREVGFVIIAVAIIMAYLLVSFISTLSRLSQESCNCGKDSCSMVAFEVPWVFYVGLFGICVMFFIGISMIVKSGSFYGRVENKEVWAEKLKTLEEVDERAVYKLLVDSNGTIFQSDIVEKTGLSKVRVTRILDSLESRRLIERKRRGLTNIVVLK